MSSAHVYRLLPREGLLEIVQSGAPADLPSARAFLDAVDRACDDAGITRLLFDNRATTSPPEDVRAAIIEWVRARTRGGSGACVIAVVLESEMLAVRLNMEAVANKSRHRAFGSIDEARAWLARQRVR
jgi:hypothetical protein